jgi:hypothetical protein
MSAENLATVIVIAIWVVGLIYFARMLRAQRAHAELTSHIGSMLEPVTAAHAEKDLEAAIERVLRMRKVRTAERAEQG